MKQLFVVAFLFISFSAFSQGSAAYEKYVNAATLKKHLTIIAGDEMQGRETGTEGQRKAAAYIEKQFTDLGLMKPAALKTHQQEYPLYKDTLKEYSFEINDNKGVLGTDFLGSRRDKESVK